MISLIWMMLLGCTKSPALLMPVDWKATPHLPTPSAATYARVATDPPDPGVRHVMGTRPWDASLGGAAAGIALSLIHQDGQLTPPEVREAAWRAGWPYPIRSVHTVGTGTGTSAPDKVKELLASVPEDVDVGMVRARGEQQDLWVVLTSRARRDIGVFPRQLAVGTKITLPALKGARYAVSDPMGTLYTGGLDVGWSVEAAADGEWLVEIVDQEGVVARFPVYVGMLPPRLSLLSAGDAPGNEKLAVAQVENVITRVREAYGLRAAQVDTLLQNAVSWAQANHDLPAADIGSRVGFESDQIWRYDCTQSTVEVCLDAMVWDPRARPYLLSNQLLLGIGAVIVTNGVHVTLLLGTDS